jgi:CHAT domain-containing protein
MKQVVRTLILMLAATAAFAGSPAGHDELGSLARSFFLAYAGGDYDGAVSLWSPRSTAIGAFRRRAQRFVRTHCLLLGSWEVSGIDVTEDAATVEIRADWLDASNMPGSIPTTDFADGKLTLHRESGQWRIVDWTPAVVTFAEAWASGDESARAAVLANPRIRCRAAVREMARRAVTLINQRQFERAGDLIADAQRIGDEIGDDAARALATASESILRRHFQIDVNASLNLAERSIFLAQHDSDPDALIRAFIARADVRSDDYPVRAMALREYVADPALVAIAATRAGKQSENLGDHWTALQYGNLALQHALESEDAAAIISAEISLTDIYHIYDDRPLYMAHMRKVAELCKRAGFTGNWADALLDEARAEIELGHRRAAKALIDEAAAEPSREGEVLLMRGLYKTDLVAADRDFTRALRWGDAHGGRVIVVEALRLLIRNRLDRGRPAEAMPFIERLNGMHGPGTATKAIFEDAALAAQAERRAGHTAAALRDVNAAIEVSERERTRILGDDRQQRSFSASRLRIYGELVTIRLDAGQSFPALVAADEAKGRTLLDMLRSKRATFEDVMSSDEQRREGELRGQAAALRRQIDAAPEAARGALAGRLEESRLQIDAFVADMAAKYPQAVPMWAPPPAMTESALRDLLTEPSLAIVEFMITDDRLHTFLIRRGAGGHVSVHARTKEIRREDFGRRITGFAAALSRADVGYRTEARKLYEMLLGPLSPHLKGVRTVCIIPDGPLWQLPFEALVAGDGRFFVEHAAPFYVPSIAVYAVMRQAGPKRGQGMFFALADPSVGSVRTDGVAVSKLRAGEHSPLPDAAREVQTAARILGGRSAVYIGASASRRRLEDEASDYRVLHFATHGVLDDTDPMYSHLVLAPSGAGDDGILETWQMMRMKLDAELAVLAACDTARGRDREGEGVVGMSWALFIAGCPSTIASQWKIASAPTADLLIDFYRQWNALRDQPLAKVRALARAQRNMLRQPKRRHPFFWAPFILVGVG